MIPRRSLASTIRNGGSSLDSRPIESFWRIARPCILVLLVTFLVLSLGIHRIVGVSGVLVPIAVVSALYAAYLVVSRHFEMLSAGLRVKIVIVTWAILVGTYLVLMFTSWIL